MFIVGEDAYPVPQDCSERVIVESLSEFKTVKRVRPRERDSAYPCNTAVNCFQIGGSHSSAQGLAILTRTCDCSHYFDLVFFPMQKNNSHRLDLGFFYNAQEQGRPVSFL